MFHVYWVLYMSTVKTTHRSKETDHNRPRQTALVGHPRAIFVCKETKHPGARSVPGCFLHVLPLPSITIHLHSVYGIA